MEKIKEKETTKDKPVLPKPAPEQNSIKRKLYDCFLPV